MSIATIKPGDRIIITEHDYLSVGDIVKVRSIDDGGDYIAGVSYVRPSQCLRILAPGDVIPKGAVTQQVMNDGTLGETYEWNHRHELSSTARWPIALASLPEPEPSLLTELDRLTERYLRDVAELRKRIEEAS